MNMRIYENLIYKIDRYHKDLKVIYIYERM